jgi:tetratricopeptide (TPR) repeat protein
MVSPEDFQAPTLLAQTYMGMGLREKSVRAYTRSLGILEKRLELNPDDVRAICLGLGTLALLGQKEKAMKWADRALSIDPNDSTVLYSVACMYAIGGDSDEALDYLERSARNGFAHREWVETDSDFESIRHLPRFKEILDTME